MILLYHGAIDLVVKKAIYIYIYIYILCFRWFILIYAIYIYIYRERERDLVIYFRHITHKFIRVIRVIIRININIHERCQFTQGYKGYQGYQGCQGYYR